MADRDATPPKRNLRIVVCGGRDFTAERALRRVLDRVHFERTIVRVAHGQCPTGGADEFADRWARDRGVDCEPYPANFRGLGRKGGPIRNGVMLRTERPDVVIAFPGGDGTADCVRQAEALSIPVYHPFRGVAVSARPVSP